MLLLIGPPPRPFHYYRAGDIATRTTPPSSFLNIIEKKMKMNSISGFIYNSDTFKGTVMSNRYM